MYKSIIFIQFCVLCTIISSINAAGFWESMVNVNRADNGDRKVGVHLPFIYWMDLNRNKNGPKLDLSVLGGLVKVNVDRKTDIGGGKNPVMVRLLGQKIYNSYPKGSAPTNGLVTSLVNQQEESKDVSIALKPTNDYKPTGDDYKPSDKIVVAAESSLNESKAPSSSAAYDVAPSTTEQSAAQ